MRGMVRAVCAAKLVTAHCSSPREEQERRVAAGPKMALFSRFFFLFSKMENRGFDPRTSRMLNGRSTN